MPRKRTSCNIFEKDYVLFSHLCRDRECERNWQQTMKVVVQRVLQASVTVDGEIVGSIGRGLCVLVGISRYDTPKDADFIVRKLLNLRVFEDADGKRWQKSVKDNNYEILCVSQFTLYSKLKGNKPDFHLAMGPDQSESFYHNFLLKLRDTYNTDLVKDGKFGAFMQVNIQNDGPVTIEIESPLPAELNVKQEPASVNSS